MSVLDRFDVRPRNTSLIDWLSGGNQQKVFVGRWLETGARLYIMEEPTAGVDIGAKGTIHRILRDIAAEGAAVLVVSSDFEEVASLCDRALVIARGTIAAELSGPSLTLDGLMTRSALGANPDAPARISGEQLVQFGIEKSAAHSRPPARPIKSADLVELDRRTMGCLSSFFWSWSSLACSDHRAFLAQPISTASSSASR